MRARRVLLVTNPGARLGTRRHDVALEVMRRSGVAVDDAITSRPGESAELVRRCATAYDAVFTLGGDGTAIEVLGALARSGCPVGILPGGTGNQIARILGIPLDVRTAAAALLRGETARIDLARLADGRCFAIAGGVGIDATMIERTPGWLKRHLGVSAYALTGIALSLRHDTFDVRASVDGEIFERRAVAVLVANFGAVLRDRLRFGPRICHDDGLLDLCIFSSTGALDSVGVGWRLLRQRFADERRMLYRQGRHITIETTPVRTVQLDGDMAGTTPFEVDVEPLAATVLVPRATLPADPLVVPIPHPAP